MKSIFINSSGQLRSGWKITVVMGMALAITLILSFILVAAFMMVFVLTQSLDAESPMDLGHKLGTELANNPLLNYINMLLSPTVFFLATYLGLKLIDKKKIRDFGLTSIRHDHRDLLYGLALGALSIVFVFFVLLGTNNIFLVNGFAQPKFSWSLLTGLILFIVVGISEEFFSRGYCMVVLKQTGTKWVPVIVSSIIFTLLHSMNPNVTFLGLANIFLIGLLFAYMFLARGNLWMPIGYHITWNYFMGNIFGFPVSGLAPEGIYNISFTSENFINGGHFGPEGGIVVTIVIILGFFIVRFLIPKKSSHISQVGST